MKQMLVPDNPYFLLTPGPLSTTPSVKTMMLRDWCTWDDDYNAIVESIRKQITIIGSENPNEYTTVLMQGSGTFSVESVIGSVIPTPGKLLVLSNGAYGDRIAAIAERLHIDHIVLNSGELRPPDLNLLKETLETIPDITHVAVVHCETTTGMLNPVEKIGEIVRQYGKIFIVDAMSSFGGIPVTMESLNAHFLVSSANKCIQGVPGFGFIIAKRETLETCKGVARSLSLDLFDQWREMETKGGKWRYTSPTHVVRAFSQALTELMEEGGVEKRHARYSKNHEILVRGMQRAGFETLLPPELQSPIITAFHSPASPAYDFKSFYTLLKEKGFVIYPGKVTDLNTFRIGNIGDVYPEDMENLTQAVKSSVTWADATVKQESPIHKEYTIRLHP